MSKKRLAAKNLPSESKQTAGGVTGAVIGGIVAGPVGAVAQDKGQKPAEAREVARVAPSLSIPHALTWSRVEIPKSI